MQPKILALFRSKYWKESVQLETTKYSLEVVELETELIKYLESNLFPVLIYEINIVNTADIESIQKVKSLSPEQIIILISDISNPALLGKLLEENVVYDIILNTCSIKAGCSLYNLQFSIERAIKFYSLNSKMKVYLESENKLFRSIVEIFDWKKELNSKKIDSIAGELIHQINIGLLQGAGFGSLISSLSIFLSRSKFNQDIESYTIPEKIFSLVREGYDGVTKLTKSLSVTQNIMMEHKPYTDKIKINEVYKYMTKWVKDIEPMLFLKRQRVILGNFPQFSQNIGLIFNPSKMELAFKELLTNAMKYSADKDEMFIIFMQENNFFEIKILNPAYPNSDGSVGITGSNASRVFEPFYRLSSVMDDRYQDEVFRFGLGMTVVNKIIDLHSGSIALLTVDNNIREFKRKDVSVWLRFPMINLETNQEK